MMHIKRTASSWVAAAVLVAACGTASKEKTTPVTPAPSDSASPSGTAQEPETTTVTAAPSLAVDPVEALKAVLPAGWQVSDVRKGRIDPGPWGAAGPGMQITVSAPGSGAKGPASLVLTLMEQPFEQHQAGAGQFQQPNYRLGENQRWTVYVSGGAWYREMNRDLCRALELTACFGSGDDG